MLLVLLLVLLFLLLLEGACVVTPLLTKRVGIRGVGKNETKWGSDVSWNKLGFKTLSL
jgi:hypothetical protein